MKFKSLIYKVLKINNDINAIKKGRIKQRIGRRIAGRTTGKLMRRIFK